MKNAIVLGGTHDHIRLIEILKQHGFYVILIDYLDNPAASQYTDDHVKESTTDKEKVLQIAIEKKASLIISTCIDSALATVAYVSEKLGLPCHISYDTALALTNKSLMKEKFVQNRIPTSKFHILKDGNHLFNNDLSFPVVVKPVDANSSKGVEKVVTSEELQKSILKAYEYSPSNSVIVEEFKDGKELSVDVIVINGIAHIIMITENVKSIINETNFTIVQSKYPVPISESVISEIERIATNISIAYNIQNAPLLIQLINKKEELSVIEFSSRIGGGSKHHFIKQITKFDLLNAFVDQILGITPLIKISNNVNQGIIQYLYTNTGIINTYKGFQELIENGTIVQYFIYKPIGTEVHGHYYSSDRPAGIMITANNSMQMEERIQKALSTIKIMDESGSNMLL